MKRVNDILRWKNVREDKYLRWPAALSFRFLRFVRSRPCSNSLFVLTARRATPFSLYGGISSRGCRGTYKGSMLNNEGVRGV